MFDFLDVIITHSRENLNSDVIDWIFKKGFNGSKSDYWDIVYISKKKYFIIIYLEQTINAYNKHLNNLTYLRLYNKVLEIEDEEIKEKFKITCEFFKKNYMRLCVTEAFLITIFIYYHINKYIYFLWFWNIFISFLIDLNFVLFYCWC